MFYRFHGCAISCFKDDCRSERRLWLPVNYWRVLQIEMLEFLKQKKRLEASLFCAL